MKTSKEKAIEALREVSGIVSHPEHNNLIADIAYELSKPTLDDAINIVEKIGLTYAIPGTSRQTIYTVAELVRDTILTALKGLKGE